MLRLSPPPSKPSAPAARVVRTARDADEAPLRAAPPAFDGLGVPAARV